MTARTFLYSFFTPWFPVLREEGAVPRWALTSSLLILAVLLVRALLRKKISLRLRYALWAVVLLRLLIPAQLPLSLPAAPARLTEELPYQLTYPTVPIYPAPNAPDAVSSEMYRSPNDRTQATFTQTLPGGERVSVTVPIWSRYQVMLTRWWGGVLVVAGTVAVSNLHFYRKLKKRRTPLEVEAPLPVYVADGLPSPCLFGVFRPAIYLTPEAAADETIRTHVMAHELTHYLHRDHLWAAARCLCLALHWYNPLVWLAASLSKRDGELACDEGAVARLGEGERISYGKTLVGLVARRAVPADLFSCSTAMTGGKKTVQQRIELLVKKPETVKTALFAAVSVLALCLVFVFAKGADTRSEYQIFMDRVESAQAIHVGMPLYSSTIFVEPIRYAGLLQEAQELLRQADPIGEREEDFSDAAFWCQRITLQARDDDSGATYRLYTGSDACYLAEAGGEWDSPFGPFATLPRWTAQVLERLARGQNYLDIANVVMDPARRLALESVEYDEEDQEEELLLTHSYQDQRILYLVKVTHRSHACGLSHLMAGVWDSEKQRFEDVYDLGGDEGLYSAWTTEDGALYLLCANSTTYQGFTTGHPPLWLKFENGELTRLTALPDIAWASGVELPSDPVFFDESYAGSLEYWYDHMIIPGGSGFTLYERTPGWDNIGFENVPQWQELGYVHLAEVDEVADGPYVWGHGQDFAPDLDRRGEWDTNLRVVVTRERGALTRQTMGSTGEAGGIETLYIGPEGVSFVLAGWNPDSHPLSDYGATIESIYDALAPEKPDELSSWFRVIKDGQIIPGSASFDGLNGEFTFAFDKPLGLPYVGAQAFVEIGP